MVKEADMLAANGYNVTVMYAYWNDWGTRLDDELLATKKWKAIRVGGDPVHQPFVYFLSRLIYKLASLFARWTGARWFTTAAVARSSFFLVSEAKKHQADLYIGHNLGALPATVIAAKKHSKPCGFDAEDFHRNELSDNETDFEVKLKTQIENKFILMVTYFSASSGPIANAYQQLYPMLYPLVIRNVFSKKNIAASPLVNNYNKPLKLVWISQTIGPNRGLETLIEALDMIGPEFELHLLGQSTVEFNKLLNRGKTKLHFYAPISSDQLAAFAALFDIGLALEPGFSINNNLALSNKIFTYLQAGLAIIASDTTAQQGFLNQHPSVGKLYKKGSPESLAQILSYYHHNREQLFETRGLALQLAREELNWETEKEQLLKLINSVITAANNRYIVNGRP